MRTQPRSEGSTVSDDALDGEDDASLWSSSSIQHQTRYRAWSGLMGLDAKPTRESSLVIIACVSNQTGADEAWSRLLSYPAELSVLERERRYVWRQRTPASA